MTSHDYEGLAERLERVSKGYYPRPINPDGPEAAEAIHHLIAERDRLEEALRGVQASAGFIELSRPLQWSIEDAAMRAVDAALSGRKEP